MRYPSDFLPPRQARCLRGNLGLLGLGLLAMALGEPMRAHSDALVTQAAPLGILSLQFACRADAAKLILLSWDTIALGHARLSLLWDCGFAPAYGVALAALTERLAQTMARRGVRHPHALAWLPLWAALADLLENLLHFLLIDGAASPLATPGCALAAFKWGALALWLAALLGLALRAIANRVTRA